MGKRLERFGEVRIIDDTEGGRFLEFLLSASLDECKEISLILHSLIHWKNCFYLSVFFSEENVWKLCERIRDEQVENLPEYYAVFISNATRQVCNSMCNFLLPFPLDTHSSLQGLPSLNICILLLLLLHYMFYIFYLFQH